MLYEDKPIIKDVYGFEFADNCHMLGESKPCMMCGNNTKAIDVFSEGHICSEECQKKFDQWCNDTLNN